ncbi:hypothetical protein BJV82DRAFT_274683 [Fennellomyces sp. T-0311]|nr:hypothetical protein BJV82DRAFT_274683 [Fennellomyces sp. T-0311]
MGAVRVDSDNGDWAPRRNGKRRQHNNNTAHPLKSLRNHALTWQQRYLPNMAIHLFLFCSAWSYAQLKVLFLILYTHQKARDYFSSKKRFLRRLILMEYHSLEQNYATDKYAARSILQHVCFFCKSSSESHPRKPLQDRLHIILRRCVTVPHNNLLVLSRALLAASVAGQSPPVTILPAHQDYSAYRGRQSAYDIGLNLMTHTYLLHIYSVCILRVVPQL